MGKGTYIFCAIATIAMMACSTGGDGPLPPVIENVTAEPDVYSAIVSFHVSGGLESVKESGVRFGVDQLEGDSDWFNLDSRVEEGQDPSLHDFIIIEIKNLEPATRYYYQVFIGNGMSRIESDIYTFTTHSATTTPPEPEPEPEPDPDWLQVSDEAFQAALIARFDKDSDGGLDPDEVELVTEIDVCDLGLTDLTGIELFPNLKKLLCSGNLIAELDISACPVLNYLDCNPMQDEYRQTVLKTIYIRRNQPIDYIDKPDKTVIRIKE